MFYLTKRILTRILIVKCFRAFIREEIKCHEEKLVSLASITVCYTKCVNYDINVPTHNFGRHTSLSDVCHYRPFLGVNVQWTASLYQLSILLEQHVLFYITYTNIIMVLNKIATPTDKTQIYINKQSFSDTTVYTLRMFIICMYTYTHTHT